MLKKSLLIASIFAASSAINVQAQATKTKTTTTKTTVTPSTKTTTTVTQTTADAKLTPNQQAVKAAFDKLVKGIESSDVKAVTDVYNNSPQTLYYNNNGSVTRGWEQDKKNRELRYPNTTNAKLEVRDVRIETLGNEGAFVACQWTQTQDYNGVSEVSTGRMTLVFRKIGNAWKIVHLHTSPDRPDANRPVFPSERTQLPN